MTFWSFVKRSLDTLRPWMPYVLLVAVAVFAWFQWSGRRGAEGELAKERERAALLERDLTVALEEPDLRPLVAVLERYNDALVKALREAEKAGATRPVVVAHAETPPSPATGTPTTTDRPCLLAEGDPLVLKVDEVLLETKAGNRVLVGTASAYRGDALLLRAPFSTPATWIRESPEPPERAVGWGWGAAGFVSPAGWAVGPAVSPPPMRVPLLGLRLDLTIGGGIGPDGHVAAAATVVLRR